MPTKIDAGEFAKQVRRCQSEGATKDDHERLAGKFLFPLAEGYVRSIIASEKIPDGIEFDDLVSECVVTCWRKVHRCSSEATPRQVFNFFTKIAARAVSRAIESHYRQIRRR